MYFDEMKKMTDSSAKINEIVIGTVTSVLSGEYRVKRDSSSTGSDDVIRCYPVNAVSYSLGNRVAIINLNGGADYLILGKVN